MVMPVLNINKLSPISARDRIRQALENYKIIANEDIPFNDRAQSSTVTLYKLRRKFHNKEKCDIYRPTTSYK